MFDVGLIIRTILTLLVSYTLIFRGSFIDCDANEFIIDNAPESTFEDSPFEIDVHFFGEAAHYSNKKYYLRAVMSKPDSSKYFGYIQSQSGNWGNSVSEKSNLFQMDLNEEGSWSGKLSIKADTSSSYFNGAGKYELKIGRYTETGTTATWSDNSVELQINAAPTPTITPLPSQTPKPEPTSVISSSLPPSPTPNPTLNTQPSSKPTEYSSAPVIKQARSIMRYASVAGIINYASKSASMSAQPQNDTQEESAASKPYTSFALLSVGVLSLVYGLWPVLKDLVVSQ